MSDTGLRAQGVLERFFVHAGAEAHDGDPKGAAQRVEHAHKKPGREHEVVGLDAYGDWPGQARVLHDRIRETIWVHDIVICAEAIPVMVFPKYARVAARPVADDDLAGSAAPRRVPRRCTCRRLRSAATGSSARGQTATARWEAPPLAVSTRGQFPGSSRCRLRIAATGSGSRGHGAPVA